MVSGKSHTIYGWNESEPQTERHINMDIDDMFKQERGRIDLASKEVPRGCVPVRYNFCQKVSKEMVSLTDKTHPLQNAEEAHAVHRWKDVTV